MTRSPIHEILREVDSLLGPTVEDRPRNVHKYAWSHGVSGLRCWSACLHRLPTKSASEVPRVDVSYEWTPQASVAAGW